MTVTVSGHICTLADNVKETTSTTGTGTYQLNGAIGGFVSFLTALGNGAKTLYRAQTGTSWEIGVGTVASGSPPTLARTLILKSSAPGDAAVSWSAGAKDIFVVAPTALLDQIGSAAGLPGSDTISNTILSNMAPWTFKVRNAGTTGDPSDAAVGNITTDVVPAAGDFLLGFLSTGEIRKWDISTITGTGVPGPDSVTNTALANMPAWSFKVRNTGSSGDPSDAGFANISTDTVPASGDFIIGFLSSGEIVKWTVSSIQGTPPTLGTAASRNVGVATVDEIPDRADADARYARLAAGNTFSSSNTFSANTTVSGTATFNGAIVSNNTVSIDGATTVNNQLFVSRAIDTNRSIEATNTSGTFASQVVRITAGRPQANSYMFLQCLSDIDGSAGGPDTEFFIDGDGSVRADSSILGGGAGYAEYYEWEDGNPNAEDRVGITVIPSGRKNLVRPALEGEEPIGVVTGRATVIGNVEEMHWRGKYKTDEYGRRLRDDDGHRILSQEYDRAQEYTPRSARPEYACVSLLGLEYVRPGQPVGAGWRLMDSPGDGSPESWLILPGGHK